MKAVTAAEKHDLKTPPYTQHLAESVRDALGELVSLPDQQIVADIISEALFQAAQDALRGNEVSLEYIGRLNVQHPGTDQIKVMLTPDPWLLHKPSSIEPQEILHATG
ncbi:MAG: hypothetical protein RPU42_14465 [Candidatus Sedimenticola sp. (ex Thyasira tokunagai)]